MIIHDIVNGKHTHCRKCTEKRADEVKRSTKILKQKCFLLFPTKGLPNPISLPGSSNTADTVSQLAYTKKKKASAEKSIDFISSTMDKLSDGAFELMVSLITLPQDKIIPWEAFYNFLVDIHNGNTSSYVQKVDDTETFQELIDVIGPDSEALLNNLEELDYAQGSLSINDIIGIESVRNGTPVLATGNTASKAKSKLPHTDDFAMQDALGHDMATLREPSLGRDNRLSLISAFSENDKRYPDGSDPLEVAAFQDRRYKIICALPGSAILLRQTGLIKISDILLTPNELSADMVRRITELVDRWSSQEYQCNNCTEDGHSIAYVIQAVDHKDPESNHHDTITSQNDLFIIGGECAEYLINNPDHFVGFDADVKGDIVFSSKQALDSVSQAMEVFHMCMGAIQSSIEADKRRKLEDAPKAVACVVDNGDSVEIRYCGRPMEAKMGDNGQPMQKVDANDYHPVRYNIPVGGHSASFVRMCKKMIGALAVKNPEYFMVAETVEDFDEILVDHVKTRVTDGYGIDMEDPEIKAEAAMFGSFSKGAIESILSIMHEVFDTSMYVPGYRRESPVTKALITQRDINQTLDRQFKSTGFVIDFTNGGGRNADDVKMIVRTPSEKTEQAWKDAVIVCDAQVEIKTEEDDNAEGIAKECPIHISWFRKNTSQKRAEVAAVDGNTILSYMQNKEFAGDDEEAQLDAKAKNEVLKHMNTLYNSLDATEYDIVIDDPESVESALATIRSAISMWDAFITKAMAVSYENLTMISDKIKLSTKGVFRRFKFFGFDLFVQAPNENSKIKMYVDFRASADPSVKAQLVDRFNLSLTDKGNVSSSQKMSVGDADVITYNTIKDMLGDVTFKRVFSLLGVPCTSKDKFVQFLKDKGLMSDVEIRQMLRDDAANNAKSSINSLTQDEFERLVNMISNAYHTVVEKRNVQRFVTIDKSYV